MFRLAVSPAGVSWNAERRTGLEGDLREIGVVPGDRLVIEEIDRSIQGSPAEILGQGIHVITEPLRWVWPAGSGSLSRGR